MQYEDTTNRSPYSNSAAMHASAVNRTHVRLLGCHRQHPLRVELHMHLLAAACAWTCIQCCAELPHTVANTDTTATTADSRTTSQIQAQRAIEFLQAQYVCILVPLLLLLPPLECWSLCCPVLLPRLLQCPAACGAVLTTQVPEL
jgi:hypothetical protein